ncbi:MAG TPA: Tim44/TimA family putative adaptor protein [Micavibrio sp.]|nr:Tim44/TimA family putative adaptor protein [Micavibrio sp.]
MQADPMLILYAIVAAGLVFWLRSLLGTRSGDERERPNPFTAPPPEARPRSVPYSDEGVPASALADEKPALPRNVSIASEDTERALLEIARLDTDFDLAKFSMGAQDAFAIIVESFAGGDRDTLKNLLEPQVYEAFHQALSQREESGETMSTEIHAVRKAEILGAKVDDRIAHVTIRFIADETCVIRAKDGTILSGDPDRITEMNDIWTFSRPVRSRDPRWLLHETRDGDVREDHKTPVPDTV